MSKKLTQLSALTSLNSTDLLYVVRAGVSYKIAFSNLTLGTFQEISFTGAIDGVNTTFVASSLPLQVFEGGVLQTEGVQYTLVGLSLVFNTPPFADEGLRMFGVV